MEKVKVFIAYSPGSKAQSRRVARLVAALRRDGLECATDSPEEGRSEDWSLWALKTLLLADFVVVVCGEGLGDSREGLLLDPALREPGRALVIPVVFESADLEFVPESLRESQVFALDEQSGYDGLLAFLTGSEAVQAAERRITRGEKSSRRGFAAAEGEDEEREPSSPPLHVNQWIRDAGGATSKMDQPLETGRNYVFCFEISVEGRPDADAEEFEEPEGLDRPDALVELQVRSPLLLAEDGFARRRVDYRPDRGLETQEFPLYSRTVIFDAETGSLTGWSGQHPLEVQLLLDGRPVYSHSWTITVEPLQVASIDPPPVAFERPAPTKASLPDDYEVAGMPALRAAVDWANQVTLEVKGRPPIRGADMDREKLIRLAAGARKILNAFSRLHAPGEDGKLEWEEVWADLLYKMIDWGRKSAEAVLGGPGQYPVIHQVLEGLQDGSRLHIDSDNGGFPWEWLYTGAYPELEAPPLGSAKCRDALRGFWGLRFQLEVMPYGDYNRTRVRGLLSKRGEAKVLAALNSTTDRTAAPLHAKFFRDVGGWPAVRSVVYDDSAKVTEALKKAIQSAADSCHLLYVFAHHSSGDLLDARGYYDFGDSTLYLKGKDQDPWTRSDIENGIFRGDKFLPGAAPLVLLNACGTAAGGEYFPCGLLPFFVIAANAPAALGTIAEINTMAAHQFGSEFLTKWLEGNRACTALSEIRRRWLFENGNPYALYYTILGDGDVRLA